MPNQKEFQQKQKKEQANAHKKALEIRNHSLKVPSTFKENEVMTFPITTRNAVRNHKKQLQKEEKVIKKMKRYERKAFNMRAWDDSDSSRDEELERVIR